MADLQNRVPFTLNTNSKPTASQASGIVEQAGDAINAYQGLSTDTTRPTAVTGNAVVQRDVAVQYALDWHYGKVPNMEFNEFHLNILNKGKKIRLKVKNVR